MVVKAGLGGCKLFALVAEEQTGRTFSSSRPIPSKHFWPHPVSGMKTFLPFRFFLQGQSKKVLTFPKDILGSVSKGTFGVFPSKI